MSDTKPPASDGPSAEVARTPAPAPCNPEEVKERIVATLHTCYDPEIPVDIYDLGLIYDIAIDAATGATEVTMTLTSPNCPAAGILPGEVEAKVKSVEGVSGCKLHLVWDPPWDKDMMTEAAKLTLGID